MKITTKEEVDAHRRATIIGGLKGLAGGLAVSVPAWYYLYLRYPKFRTLQPSLKALGVVVITLPAVVITAEHAGIAFEREQWMESEKAKVAAPQRRRDAKWEQLTTMQKASDFVRNHEYGVIVGSWAIALTTAWRYISRDPIATTPQKVVQARVWAQGLTIGIIIAAGILTHAQRSRIYEEEDEHRVRRLPRDHSWKDALAQSEKEKEQARLGGPGVGST